MSVALAITEAALAAAWLTRAFCNTAGVEASLAPDRSRPLPTAPDRSRPLPTAPDRSRFGDLPVTATIQRDLVLVTALAKEFCTAAEEIMLEASVPGAYPYERSRHGRRRSVA